MNPYSFIKVSAAVPALRVADPVYNVSQMIEILEQASAAGSDILLFPELSVTAYSCGDLFLSETLLSGAQKAFQALLLASEGKNTVVVAGLPLSDGQHIYNCAVVVQNGKICGAVPKMHLPSYGEFSEMRWFTVGANAPAEITLCGQIVPFGLQVFDSGNCRFAIEICEDLWVTNPPSASLTLSGAELVLNLSASSALVGAFRKQSLVVESRSMTSCCAYVYAASGPGESTTDAVYAGRALAAENGKLLLDETVFDFESHLYHTEIDLERIRADRRRNNLFTAEKAPQDVTQTKIAPFTVSDRALERKISPSPFVPANVEEQKKRFDSIYEVQAVALAKRLSHAYAKTAVIGISGGLDSTLALLVVARAMDILKRPRTDILAVTMPGFGTTGKTLQNAKRLMEILGTSIREISIGDACMQHFKDIGHDPRVLDVTYENTQARERTQILMDLANESGGLVIGTGDLSELALGWATYGGDHISMYGVNGGIPKTLIRHLVDRIGKTMGTPEIDAVIQDVLETPVSPELLPMDAEGKIAQKTEEILGDYILHDFFLYYFIRYGFSPEKILFLAKHAFGGVYGEEDIKKALDLFMKRFFQNQFKRSCLPDGPKIGSVSLSPRTDLKMPSDASGALWLK